MFQYSAALRGKAASSAYGYAHDKYRIKRWSRYYRAGALLMSRPGRRPDLQDHPETRRFVAVTPGYRLLSASAFGLMGLLSLQGIEETATSYFSGEALGGWIFVFLWAVLALRALRVAVVIDEDVVRVRSLVRTRTLPRSAVKAVVSVGYSGFWNWSGSSGIFKMLQLRLRDGQSLDIPEISGTPRKINELARSSTSALHC